MAERAILHRCGEKRKSRGLLELSRMDNFGDVDVVEPPREKSRNAEEAAAETHTNMQCFCTAFNNTNKKPPWTPWYTLIAGICNTENVCTERANLQIILLTFCIVFHPSKTFFRCIYSTYENIENNFCHFLHLFLLHWLGLVLSWHKTAIPKCQTWHLSFAL